MNLVVLKIKDLHRLHTKFIFFFNFQQHSGKYIFGRGWKLWKLHWCIKVMQLTFGWSDKSSKCSNSSNGWFYSLSLFHETRMNYNIIKIRNLNYARSMSKLFRHIQYFQYLMLMTLGSFFNFGWITLFYVYFLFLQWPSEHVMLRSQPTHSVTLQCFPAHESKNTSEIFGLFSLWILNYLSKIK